MRDAAAVLTGREWKVVAACVALAILPLPFGFIEVGVAELAGFWGLYAVLPMLTIVACAMLLRRSQVRVGLRRFFSWFVMVIVLLYAMYFLLWVVTAPFLLPAWLAARAATRV